MSEDGTVGHWTGKFLALAAAFLGVCTAAPALAYNSADADYDRALAYAHRAMDAQMYNPYSYAESYPATYFERAGWGHDSDYDVPAPQAAYVDNYNAYNGYTSGMPNGGYMYGTIGGRRTGTGANTASPFGIASEPGVNGYQNSPTPNPINGSPMYGGAYRNYTNAGYGYNGTGYAGYTNGGYTNAGYGGYNSGSSYTGSYTGGGPHGVVGGGHSSGGHSGGHGR